MSDDATNANDKSLSTLSTEELERRAEAYAEDELASVPESQRSYFYFETDHDVKRAFKQAFYNIMMEQYVITPPQPNGQAPSP